MKTIYKILIGLAVLLLATSLCFIHALDNSNKKRSVEQKVSIYDSKWGSSSDYIRGYKDGLSVTKKPQGTQYELITKFNGRTITDIGTSTEIDSLKCVRANQLIFEAKTLEELNKPCK